MFIELNEFASVLKYYGGPFSCVFCVSQGVVSTKRYKAASYVSFIKALKALKTSYHLELSIHLAAVQRNALSLNVHYF